jgi:hypothetical protein
LLLFKNIGFAGADDFFQFCYILAKNITNNTTAGDALSGPNDHK